MNIPSRPSTISFSFLLCTDYADVFCDSVSKEITIQYLMSAVVRGISSNCSNVTDFKCRELISLPKCFRFPRGESMCPPVGLRTQVR